MVEAKPAVTWQCPSEDGSMVLKNSTNDLKISSATSGFWDCHVIKIIPNRILQVARSPCFFAGGKNQLLVVSKKLLSGRVRRKKMHAGARKGRKVAIHSVFPMACGSGGSKSRLAKAGAEPCSQMRLWREAHFEVKMYKTHHSRTTFGNWDVQKCTPLWREAHLEVKMQSFLVSVHFWKLRCRKSVRLCGAKHISKSKCTKHTTFGPRLEVEMLKKCTPLWREAHLEVKMQSFLVSVHFWKLRCRKSVRLCGAKHISKSKCTKHTTFGPRLEVEMLKSARRCGAKHISKSNTPLWREAHFEVKSVDKLMVSEHFWKFRCRKSAFRCGAKQMSKSKVQKTEGVLSTFGCSDVVLRGRHKGFCTLSKVSKTRGFCRMSKNYGRHGTFEEDLQRCIFRGRRSTRDMFIRAVGRFRRWFPERGCIFEHQIFRFDFAWQVEELYDLASLIRGRRNTLDRWSGKIAKRIGTRPSAFHSTVHFWRKSRWIASSLRSCQLRKLRKSRWIATFSMLPS